MSSIIEHDVSTNEIVETPLSGKALTEWQKATAEAETQAANESAAAEAAAAKKAATLAALAAAAGLDPDDVAQALGV